MQEYITLYPPKNYHLLLDSTVMAGYEKQFADAERDNQQLYEQKKAAHQKLITDATALYGARSKVITYLRGNPPEAPKSLRKLMQSIRETVARLKTRAETKRKREENERRKKEQAEREAAERRAVNQERYQRHKARLEEVTAQLTAAGYVVGEDFVKYDAIRFLKAHREWVLDEETGRHKPVLIPKVPLPPREELAYSILYEEDYYGDPEPESV